LSGFHDNKTPSETLLMPDSVMTIHLQPLIQRLLRINRQWEEGVPSVWANEYDNDDGDDDDDDDDDDEDVTPLPDALVRLHNPHLSGTMELTGHTTSKSTHRLQQRLLELLSPP
jgi:hypothetical protein